MAGKGLNGSNPSGIYPTEYKVLIRPQAVAEKTKGGIIIPDERRERDQFAVLEGVLVAVSPLAFTYSDWPDNGADRPRPGDNVIFAKFAGTKTTGKDGVEYRLVNDRDITAILK